MFSWGENDTTGAVVQLQRENSAPGDVSDQPEAGAIADVPWGVGGAKGALAYTGLLRGGESW